MEDNNLNKALLEELQKQTRYLRQNVTLGLIAIIVLAIVAVVLPMRVFKEYKNKQQPAITWQQVGHYMDQGNYDEALKMSQSILQKNPNDWYANAYTGSIYLGKGDLANAEKYYKTAYQLFPSEDNDKMLTAIRKRLKSEEKKKK